MLEVAAVVVPVVPQMKVMVVQVEHPKKVRVEREGLRSMEEEAPVEQQMKEEEAQVQ